MSQLLVGRLQMRHRRHELPGDDLLLVAGHELGELDLEILSGGLGVVQDAVQVDIQVGFGVLHDHAGVALPVG